MYSSEDLNLFYLKKYGFWNSRVTELLTECGSTKCTCILLKTLESPKVSWHLNR